MGDSYRKKRGGLQGYHVGKNVFDNLGIIFTILAEKIYLTFFYKIINFIHYY